MATISVAKSYKAAYPNPIVVRAGDRVQSIRRETDHPGWVWCRHHPTGKEGWVPESIITDAGTVVKDYSAIELTVMARADLRGIWSAFLPERRR